MCDLAWTIWVNQPLVGACVCVWTLLPHTMVPTIVCCDANRMVEAGADHPGCTYCTALPFPQFRILVVWHFCDLNSDFKQNNHVGTSFNSQNQSCVCARVCVYVCVEHLNRCKTVKLLPSRFRFCFLLTLFHVISNKGTFTFVHTFLDFVSFISRYFKQGACGHHANACQRSYAWWWKPGLITLVYLLCHFKLQQWDVDNPRTTMPCSNHLFSISSFARLLQSDFPLFIEDDWAASEQFDSFSKDIERFSSHSLSLLVIQFLLSGLTGVFLHVRCIPHQNSQRCFWASVCVLQGLNILSIYCLALWYFSPFLVSKLYCGNICAHAAESIPNCEKHCPVTGTGTWSLCVSQPFFLTP